MKKSPTGLLMKLQKGLCSVPTVIEKRGFFIVPYLLWHGTLDFAISSEDRFKYVLAFYDMRGRGGVPGNYSNTDSQRLENKRELKD